MRPTHRPGGIAFAILIAPLLACGCARTVNRTAERRIRDALPRMIGPARVWRAHVESPAARTLRGRLRRVTIHGEEVELRSALRLATLDVDVRNIAVDPARGRVQSAGDAVFSAAVTERDLNEYLQRFPAPPEEPVRYRHVYVRTGRFYVEGVRSLAGRQWTFNITAEPRLASPTRLLFDPDRMAVLGMRVPLPASALRFLARILSDGFDFTALPLPVKIHNFRAEYGRIVLSGEADVGRVLAEQTTRSRLSLKDRTW